VNVDTEEKENLFVQQKKKKNCARGKATSAERGKTTSGTTRTLAKTSKIGLETMRDPQGREL